MSLLAGIVDYYLLIKPCNQRFIPAFTEVEVFSYYSHCPCGRSSLRLCLYDGYFIRDIVCGVGEPPPNFLKVLGKIYVFLPPPTPRLRPLLSFIYLWHQVAAAEYWNTNHWIKYIPYGQDDFFSDYNKRPMCLNALTWLKLLK